MQQYTRLSHIQQLFPHQSIISAVEGETMERAVMHNITSSQPYTIFCFHQFGMVLICSRVSYFINFLGIHNEIVAQVFETRQSGVPQYWQCNWLSVFIDAVNIITSFLSCFDYQRLLICR